MRTIERKLKMAAFLNFTKEKEREREENKVVQIPVAEIVPNPHQPRAFVRTAYFSRFPSEE